jgi:hypothetical protein
MTELGYPAANTCRPDDQPYVLMRFARLLDGGTEPAMFYAWCLRGDAAGKSQASHRTPRLSGTQAVDG